MLTNADTFHKPEYVALGGKWVKSFWLSAVFFFMTNRMQLSQKALQVHCNVAIWICPLCTNQSIHHWWMNGWCVLATTGANLLSSWYWWLSMTIILINAAKITWLPGTHFTILSHSWNKMNNCISVIGSLAIRPLLLVAQNVAAQLPCHACSIW